MALLLSVQIKVLSEFLVDTKEHYILVYATNLGVMFEFSSDPFNKNYRDLTSRLMQNISQRNL